MAIERAAHSGGLQFPTGEGLMMEKRTHSDDIADPKRGGRESVKRVLLVFMDILGAFEPRSPYGAHPTPQGSKRWCVAKGRRRGVSVEVR